MTIIFSNRSRSFNEATQAIHFTGYDGVFEVQFFIEMAALARIGGGSTSESGLLATFDANRGSIQEAARAAYSSSRRKSYTLTADLFRRRRSSFFA